MTETPDEPWPEDPPTIEEMEAVFPKDSPHVEIPREPGAPPDLSDTPLEASDG